LYNADFEAHLIDPKLNVYKISIKYSPGVVLGPFIEFTRSVIAEN
jgi:hypothetical protein